MDGGHLGGVSVVHDRGVRLSARGQARDRKSADMARQRDRVIGPKSIPNDEDTWNLKARRHYRHRTSVKRQLIAAAGQQSGKTQQARLRAPVDVLKDMRSNQGSGLAKTFLRLFGLSRNLCKGRRNQPVSKGATDICCEEFSAQTTLNPDDQCTRRFRLQKPQT